MVGKFGLINETRMVSDGVEWDHGRRPEANRRPSERRAVSTLASSIPNDVT